MSVPAFLTDVLESALDQGIGTPSDVLRHATPDELSKHLPRPVWKQLLTAALAATRTDARLVVDTVTAATICKHVPSPIVWNCIAELGGRSLSKPLVAPPPVQRASTPTLTPPPPVADAKGGGNQGNKKGNKGNKKGRPDEDEVEIDVAEDKKADPVPVDDDQLIDWAQTEEVAAGEADERR
jgi:hypothetical protein